MKVLTVMTLNGFSPITSLSITITNPKSYLKASKYVNGHCVYAAHNIAENSTQK